MILRKSSTSRAPGPWVGWPREGKERRAWESPALRCSHVDLRLVALDSRKGFQESGAQAVCCRRGFQLLSRHSMSSLELELIDRMKVLSTAIAAPELELRRALFMLAQHNTTRRGRKIPQMTPCGWCAAKLKAGAGHHGTLLQKPAGESEPGSASREPYLDVQRGVSRQLPARNQQQLAWETTRRRTLLPGAKAANRCWYGRLSPRPCERRLAILVRLR
ncbi:hypothetical protein VTI74DRAFT_5849 [Chaetomium olivicolor]